MKVRWRYEPKIKWNYNIPIQYHENAMKVQWKYNDSTLRDNNDITIL